MRIGIIGATGWLGSALGKRLLDQGLVASQHMVLLNRSGPRGNYHGHEGVIWAQDANDLAAQVDVVVLSVRPHDWPSLNLQADGKMVLSFMAGVRAKSLLACGGRVVRVMPNAAADIGRSYSPWWAGYSLADADRAAITDILSVIGTSDELASESQIDLMTAVSGSGAAYPALMAVAMVRFLLDHGVDETVARRSAEAAVCGGAYHGCARDNRHLLQLQWHNSSGSSGRRRCRFQPCHSARAGGRNARRRPYALGRIQD